MPTRFSVFRRSDHEISITYATPKAKKCLQLSNIGVSKRFFGVPTFFNYAIADGLYNLLFPDKTGIKITPRNKSPDFQLCFNFCDEVG